eukprot:1161734-Pelagomonas_calceolata.AAC.13
MVQNQGLGWQVMMLDGATSSAKGDGWLQQATPTRRDEDLHCVKELMALYQASLSHVAGMGPDRLAVYVEEEARVHSEKPYEYEEDDEARFRCDNNFVDTKWGFPAVILFHVQSIDESIQRCPALNTVNSCYVCAFDQVLLQHTFSYTYMH